MKGRKESSFDIHLASNLSHKLCKKTKVKSTLEPQNATPVYPPFIFRPTQEKPPSEPQVTEEDKLQAIPKRPESGFSSIDSFVRWCHEAINAESTFVVDSQGFVISNCGALPDEHSEGVGAELSYALEQLNRISDKENRLLCVNLDYDKQHIYGFQVAESDEEHFILGVVTRTPLEHRLKEAIMRTTAEVLPAIG
ncbi:MAG: hypothetical protein JXA30_22960 [Deltaproteobacteria bacterium]|nr:hypothetical protein [Deltaproteobacteria bacterium]